MYLFDVHIRGVRSLKDVHWKIPWNMETAAGWHVILGDNGSGKSSFVRSIALALVGPAEAPALRQNWADWLTKDQQRGSIRLILDGDPAYDLFSGRGMIPSGYFLGCGLSFVRQIDDTVALTKTNAVPVDNVKYTPDRYIWGAETDGFRRLTGRFGGFRAETKILRRCFTQIPGWHPTFRRSVRA